MPENETWTYTVEAFNTATESQNRMHADDVAQQFGFRGGLVPGVDVWAYLTRPCIDRWGVAFLERGTLDARFHTPVYDGEHTTISLASDGSVVATGPDGSVRASGVAGLVDAHPAFPDLPTRDMGDRPPASEETLATGTVLGTTRWTYRAPQAAQYLVDIREHADLYENGAVGHPGFLARECNNVLAYHVVLGPWIHVGTVARHRGLVHDGDEIETRGVIAEEREHKGHRFVDIDVTVTANGTPVYDAFHTAIWQPRGVR